MTKKGIAVSSSTPAVITCTTWSLGMEAPMRASLAKRSRSPTSRRISGRISLRALRIPVLLCRATNTAPMPPELSGRSMTNSRPMVRPGATAGIRLKGSPMWWQLASRSNHWSCVPNNSGEAPSGAEK